MVPMNIVILIAQVMVNSWSGWHTMSMCYHFYFLCRFNYLFVLIFQPLNSILNKSKYSTELSCFSFMWCLLLFSLSLFLIACYEEWSIHKFEKKYFFYNWPVIFGIFSFILPNNHCNFRINIYFNKLFKTVLPNCFSS